MPLNQNQTVRPCHCEECSDEAIWPSVWEIATGLRPRNDGSLVLDADNTVRIWFYAGIG
jgi:hypothetical protein